MKRIALITSGSPNNRKGFFNNVQERALRLLDAEIDGIEIDFFIIRHRDSLLFSLIRRKARPDMQPEVRYSGACPPTFRSKSIDLRRQ